VSSPLQLVGVGEVLEDLDDLGEQRHALLPPLVGGVDGGGVEDDVGVQGVAHGLEILGLDGGAEGGRHAA